MKNRAEPTSQNPSSIRQSEIRNRKSIICWHGWSIALPDEWSPVKIDGDWKKGSVLIADFHATRLALRWQLAPTRKFDAKKWAEQAIAGEVGQLMLKQSSEYVPAQAREEVRGEKGGNAPRSSLIPSSFSSGRLFVEPEPPGRDVWVGLSGASNRLLEIVYQTKTVSKVLRDQILPGISDQPPEAPQRWSIFDLSCTAPAGWKLTSQRLNAGDLTLSFGRKNDVLIIRQLAPASLALSRQPLEKWLDAQQRIWKKTYRVKGEIGNEEASVGENRSISRAIPRRRRFVLARWIMPQRVTLVTHDLERDRIVLIDASSIDLARETLATIAQEPL